MIATKIKNASKSADAPSAAAKSTITASISSGDEATHDSNDDDGEDGNNGKSTSNSNDKDEEDEANDDEEENSSSDVRADNASGKNDGQDEDGSGSDAEEDIKEDGNEGEEEEGEEEKMWELIKLLTVDEITKSNPSSLAPSALSVHWTIRKALFIGGVFMAVLRVCGIFIPHDLNSIETILSSQQKVFFSQPRSRNLLRGNDKHVTETESSGSMPYLDILDPLNPRSIAVYLDSVDKHPEYHNNDVIANPFRVQSRRVSTSTESDAKRQKIEAPTSSPTTQCNRDDYQQRRDRNAVDIRLSQTRAYAHSPDFMNLVMEASRDMQNIVNATNNDGRLSLLYNPTSATVPVDVMADVVADNWNWVNLETTSMTVIYAFVNNDSNEVAYVGYSHNMRQRMEYHQVNRPLDFFNEHTFVRLISYDNIPLEVDTALGSRLIEFWEEVVALPNLPPSMNRFYTNLLGQWHRGGIKKQQLAQLLEISQQDVHGIASPKEGFMFDAAKETHLIQLADQTGDALIAYINQFWGENVNILSDSVSAIATWKTGGREGALSSCIVATEYALGNTNWEDTIPFARFQDAATREKIFDHDYTEAEMAGGLLKFQDFLNRNGADSESPRLLLVDTQDFMFDDLIEPQMQMCEMGYKFVESFLGGEIILFRKDKVLALLHGHPANACDSRENFPILDRQRRALTMDTMRMTRQRAVGDTSPRRYDSLRGSIFAEISDRGLHGSKLFGAAICRDTMTKPDGVDAIELFGGGLTPPNNIHYPTSRAARRAEPIDSDEHWNMQRFTDQISQTGVNDAVLLLHARLERQDTGTVQRKWRQVIDWYQGNSVLQAQVRTVVRSLPGGGDVPPHRASMDGNTALENAITQHHSEHGTSRTFYFWIVKSFNRDEPYTGGDSFAGAQVFNLFTATNTGLSVPRLFWSIARRNALKTLGNGGIKFKALNKSDRAGFFEDVDLEQNVIDAALQTMKLYKVVNL